jgi:hypothetical protein
MSSRSRVGITLVRIASVYLLTNLVLDLAISVDKNFTLMSVHSHVLLLN